MNVEETLPHFGISVANPFILKIEYSKPAKIIEIWTFYISVCISMTNIIVKSHTVVYMCMEVMIWQSQMSPEMFMISQTHRMRGHKTHHIGEGIWKKPFQLLGWLCKTLPTENRIFQTIQNHWNLDITHFCICQYDKYNSKRLYSMIYVYGSYDLSVWEVP